MRLARPHVPWPIKHCGKQLFHLGGMCGQARASGFAAAWSPRPWDASRDMCLAHLRTRDPKVLFTNRPPRRSESLCRHRPGIGPQVVRKGLPPRSQSRGTPSLRYTIACTLGRSMSGMCPVYAFEGFRLCVARGLDVTAPLLRGCFVKRPADALSNGRDA